MEGALGSDQEPLARGVERCGPDLGLERAEGLDERPGLAVPQSDGAGPPPGQDAVSRGAECEAGAGTPGLEGRADRLVFDEVPQLHRLPGADEGPSPRGVVDRPVGRRAGAQPLPLRGDSLARRLAGERVPDPIAILAREGLKERPTRVEPDLARLVGRVLRGIGRAQDRVADGAAGVGVPDDGLGTPPGVSDRGDHAAARVDVHGADLAMLVEKPDAQRDAPGGQEAAGAGAEGVVGEGGLVGVEEPAHAAVDPAGFAFAAAAVKLHADQVGLNLAAGGLLLGAGGLGDGGRLGGESLLGHGVVALAGRLGVGGGEEAGRRREDQARHGDRRDCRRGSRAMSAKPAACAGGRGLAVGKNGLVGQPVLDVAGQRSGRAVAVVGLEGHRLAADRVERGGERWVDPAGREVFAALGLAEDRAEVDLIEERRLGGEQAIERGPQAVDVAGNAKEIEASGGLLGAHVLRRADGRAGQGLGRAAGGRRAERGFVVRVRGGVGPVERLGQAPINDQRFAIFTDHDVAWLQVAMEHAAAVGILDGVADVEEPPEELLELDGPLADAGHGSGVGMEPLEGVGQAVAADEPHRVERPASGVVAEAVDRDDAGMLQAAGDLGFEHEPGAAARVVGVPFLDFFERDLAVQFAITRHEDLAEPSLGVRTEPLVTSDSREIGGRGIPRGAGVGRCDADQAGADVDVGQAGQQRVGLGVDRADRSQARLDRARRAARCAR